MNNLDAECNLSYVDFASPTVLFYLPAPNNKGGHAGLTLKTKPAAWNKAPKGLPYTRYEY